MLSDWWLRTLDSMRLLVGVQGGLERFADGSATLGPVACTDALGSLLPAPSLLARRLGFLRLARFDLADAAERSVYRFEFVSATPVIA